MDKKPAIFVGTWFGTSIITVIFSFVFLIYLTTTREVINKNTSYLLYQALPNTQTSFDFSINPEDGRAKIVEDFFAGYGSILGAYGEFFVQSADKYRLDYRLLPAIAMQESSGGKKMIEGSFNPFGFGIYGSNALHFNSFEEAIETVARSLRQDYLDEGLTTPERIMSKYTPPSLASGGTWAIEVSNFMDELK